ncbi:hypothetical protein ESCO_005416 [Escovopsis weberi]|uniref:Myb-like DNA-binding domain-containing protein n=1 Tax=Escovopsis weberi TaxID=150374 RepID=A0A0M8N5V0_ESCWE|nr:hypothetical protein ESCO_005416 [Escovopsis weberi]
MASETPKKEPTPAEAMFFFSILKNMKNKADIDWQAVAADQNFKNAEVAKVRFGQVKRKLGISSDAPSTAKSAGPTPTKVTKSTGRSGKKGKAAAAAASSTPSHVKMENAREMMRAMQDDDNEESPSKSFIVKRELLEADEKKFGGGEGLMLDADPF